jgi:hypothetical protein
MEKEDPKGYQKEVNGPNGNLWKEVVDKGFNSLNRARTWDVVDKIERGKEVSSI